MGKLIALVFIIMLAVASITSYFLLTQKITAGKERIAAGQLELKKGKEMLAAGKAKLANGKRQLSGPNQVYKAINAIPFMGLAEMLPVSGTVINEATKQIKEGDEMVASGEVKVKSGEARLAKGQLELNRGEQRLNVANTFRVACGLTGEFLVALAVVLGYFWRKSIAQVFKRR